VGSFDYLLCFRMDDALTCTQQGVDLNRHAELSERKDLIEDKRLSKLRET
jgi:hypothetical protein